MEEFHEQSIGRQYNAFAYRKPFPNLSLRIQLAESLLALADRDGFFSACSACVFFGLAKAHVETRKEGRKWGESKGAGYFFSPPPPFFPSFALSPTPRATIFTLPNLPPS